MTDITYCDNGDCPFFDCDRHIKNVPFKRLVSVANFAGTCRDYINYLIDTVKDGE